MYTGIYTHIYILMSFQVYLNEVFPTFYFKKNFKPQKSLKGNERTAFSAEFTSYLLYLYKCTFILLNHFKVCCRHGTSSLISSLNGSASIYYERRPILPLNITIYPA